MADTYVNTTMTSTQVTSLMRRINALEAGIYLADSYDRQWSVDGGASNPEGIVLIGGTVYVSSALKDKVFYYDTDGVLISSWGTNGSGAGQFRNPQHMTVLGGEIYVAEADNNRIQVYSSSGVYDRQWTGSAPDALNAPEGVYGFSSEIYVADTGTGKVKVYNTSGTLQRQWASSGCRSIWIYNSLVYVGRPSAGCVSVYDTSGTLQSTIGSGIAPYGVCVASNNGFVEVYATNTTEIKVYDTDGNSIRTIGTSGSGDGQFSDVQGVVTSSITGTYEMYTTDIGNDRVQVFTIGSGSIGQTTFYSYTTTAATSLGTPDGGVAVPALAALTPANNNADLIPRHIVDMRDAIETLAPYFTNAATGNPFNWTASSADNLYFVAMGDRTEYGATGGAAYDWTRTEAQMETTFCYSIDIGEINSCITLLEAS